jgi:hypothetical protein
MKVIGTATIRFSVNLDVEDISTNAMPINESDELIADAILEKYGVIAHDIFVEEVREEEGGNE